MIKRVIGSTLGMLLLTWASVPAAHARFYLLADVGWNFLVGNDELEDDLVYGGGLGIDFGGPAIELTANYGTYKGTEDLSFGGQVGADIDVLSLGLAGRYNIDFNPARLYFLVGAAYHVVDFTTEDSIAGIEQLFKNDQNQWGMVFGGGLEIKIGDHFTVGPDVRYNLVFSDSFDTIDQIKNADLAKYPDFLELTGRVTVYF